MNKINSVAPKTQISIAEKKSKKNRIIIFFSVLGLSTLTVSVSLPLGFLTNLVSPLIIEETITTPYDPN
ncbi:MAG: hypothetical protein RSC02_02485, partial [Malacoplasma sp.]